MDFGKIVIVEGGPSSEAEISRKTGSAIYNALKELNHNVIKLEFNPETFTEDIKNLDVDIVFNAVHGKYGEDGYIAASLYMLGIPYTSCSVLSSAITMDKIITKNILSVHNISTPKARFFSKKNWQKQNIKQIIEEFSFPLVIKASSQGSSIGVFIANTEVEVEDAISECFKLDDEILIEKFIKGRELSVPIICKKHKEALPIIEITTTTGKYDYHTKYTAGESTHIIPAPLDEKLKEEIDDLCIRACDVTKCSGVVRIDVMLSEENIPYILEINTVPGMTNTSLVPDSANSVGISFGRLCEMILEMASVK